MGDVALAHAQHVVQAQFAVALLHQKRARVEQEDRGEEDHDPDAEIQHHDQAVAAGHRADGRVAGQVGEHGGDGGHRAAGEQIGRVQAALLADVVRGQARIQREIHARSPPVVSSVSVSAIFWYMASRLMSPR